MCVFCFVVFFLAESYFLSVFKNYLGCFVFTPDPFGSDNLLVKVVGTGNIPVLLLEQNTCCA